MTFLEKCFPSWISFGASGGPQRRTRILTFANGHEIRATNWAGSRRRYDAGTGIRSLADLHHVLAFFEETRGRLIGFRFKDPFDHSTAAWGQAITAEDELIATGNGTATTFQLTKAYGDPGSPYKRIIRKPVSGTLRLAVDGVPVALGPQASLDTQTGLVTFHGDPPAVGARVTAGFEFHTPVRFDTDHLEASLTHFSAGQVPSVPLVEINL